MCVEPLRTYDSNHGYDPGRIRTLRQLCDTAPGGSTQKISIGSYSEIMLLDEVYTSEHCCNSLLGLGLGIVLVISKTILL